METFEELLTAYLKAKGAMEEMEAAKKVVEEAILEKLRAMKLTGTSVNGFNIQKVTRSSFTDVLMSVAEELGAVKIEKKLDTIKLKKLEENGVKIKGIKRIQYLLVKEEKK